MPDKQLRRTVTSPSARRMSKLVIFDCDGVLVDSERLAIKVDVELLAELGWVMTETEAEVETRLGRALPPSWKRPGFPKNANRWE